MTDNQSIPQTDSPRIGVYVCHCGGNISDTVDVAAVTEAASHLPGVTVAQHNSFMCSDPGQELIAEDIRSGKVDRVVVASCAPSLHETTFRAALVRAGLNPYLYEHANIREQVSWVHHGPGATAKATGLVAAAAAKAARLTNLEPIRVEAVSHATVIGGGVAGLSAALALARRGIKVTLVEKGPFLGGNAARLDRLYPTGQPVGELVADLAGRVLDHPDVEVLTSARVTAHEGYVGQFRLKVVQSPPSSAIELEKLAALPDKKPGPEFIPFVGVWPAQVIGPEQEIEIETGAVVLATGFKHYEPFSAEYGYGERPEVVTLPEFIQLLAAAEDGEHLVVNQRPIRSAVFIHCVGSRQVPGLYEPPDGRPLNEYCSRVCCTATLQATNELKDKFPETAVYELYRDIRTYGRGAEDYYVGAGRKGVVFARFTEQDPPMVRSAPAGIDAALTVTVKDTLLSGRELDVPADLVVLAVGMETAPVDDLVELMKLPVGADRFLLEVHPKLRPVELATTGIFLAGTCQAPLDIGESAAAAAAAAVKAAALLARGHVDLDPFVAEVDSTKCVGHGECVQACIVEGALTLTDRVVDGQTVRRAEVNPALCRGCGVCVAVCPARAIQVAGWRLDQYEAMVDAVVAQGA
jgi:heterodisulfide reductase subunit A